MTMRPSSFEHHCDDNDDSNDDDDDEDDDDDGNDDDEGEGEGDKDKENDYSISIIMTNLTKTIGHLTLKNSCVTKTNKGVCLPQFMCTSTNLKEWSRGQ